MARIVRRAAGSNRTTSASRPTSRAPFEPRPNRRAGRRREEVDHPLEGDPTCRDALAVKDRQQRLDAGGTVADLVERHAVRGLGLLGVDPIGHVVGRDKVERAVGEASPQGLAVDRRPERRGDDERARTRRDRGRRSVPRSGPGSAGRSRPRPARRPPSRGGPRRELPPTRGGRRGPGPRSSARRQAPGPSPRPRHSLVA